MADDRVKKGKLSCNFDDKSGAATIVKDGAVLASSSNLEKPMQIMVTDRFYRVGDSISEDPKTQLPKAVDDGFVVNTKEKNCDVNLADGSKLRAVPMAPASFGPK